MQPQLWNHLQSHFFLKSATSSLHLESFTAAIFGIFSAVE
jgi:hypothetical protein